MKQYIILISINVLAIVAIVFWVSHDSKKTAYIDLNKVFTEFELTKEYDDKLTNYQNKAKSILDSLELEINAMARQLESGDNNLMFEQKKENYFTKRDEFETGYQGQTQQYTAQAMKQLSQYIGDYGKENGYTYIYGADGKGTLMYADEKEEITQDVIVYVNKKYSGKKN